MANLGAGAGTKIPWAGVDGGDEKGEDAKLPLSPKLGCSAECSLSLETLPAWCAAAAFTVEQVVLVCMHKPLFMWLQCVVGECQIMDS